MNNNNLKTQININYSLISLLIIEYLIVSYNIITEKKANRSYLHLEILGFITILLLLYNYYNFFYIKEIFIILLIFIIVRLFIFTYVLSKFDIENYFSSNNIKAMAE